MKFLYRAFNTIPEQVLSTFIISTLAYIVIRGVASLWNNPPTPNAVLVILFVGICLGVITAIAPEKPPKKSIK